MPRLGKADPIAAKIGERVCAIRESQGLTQEKLAYECGLKSKGHLSGIEKGLVRPTLNTLVALAERLEVDLLDLVTFPDESQRQRLVDLTRKMKLGTIRRLVRDRRRVIRRSVRTDPRVLARSGSPAIAIAYCTREGEPLPKSTCTTAA